MPEPRHVFRALRHRNFRLFFVGQLVSLIGTWMQTVAQSWLVYRLTGSTVLLGVVGFCGQIPVLFLAPIGGLVADRYRKHPVLLATQSAMMGLAFVLAALTLSGRVRVGHVFVLASLLGVANAFDIPARQSFIPQMVGREDLVNAIGLNSSMVNGARIIGPALAGVTVASIGEGWCFFVNGVSFLAVLGGLLAMRNLPAKGPAPSGTPLERMAAGLAYVRRTPPVRALLLLLGVASLAGGPYVVLMPAIVDRTLHRGADGFGILMSAAGAGALSGALALAARRHVMGLGRWVWSAAVVFGMSLVAFSASRSFWLSAACLVPVGAGYMVQTAASNTLLQSLTPDAMRGRVMAGYSMMIMGVAPIGALVAGAVASRLGSTLTVGVGGACCVVAGLVFARSREQLRASARAIFETLAATDLEAPPPPPHDSDVARR